MRKLTSFLSNATFSKDFLKNKKVVIVLFKKNIYIQMTLLLVALTEHNTNTFYLTGDMKDVIDQIEPVRDLGVTLIWDEKF